MKIAAASRCGTICRAIAAGLALLPLLAGCATPLKNTAAIEETNDPLEPLNRRILEVNQFVDRILLKPVAKTYIAIVPEGGRDVIRHIVDNMKEPTLFFNNVLQGDLERAGITLSRFAVNSSLGLGGAIDVAAKWDLKRQNADFGQTLFVWGVPDGPYLVLPILGPSNPRDAIGMGIDSYSDPFTILAHTNGVTRLTTARFAANGIDERSRVIDVLDQMEKDSVDFYAQLRSLSRQHRAAELRRGEAPEPGANFYADPGKGAPDTTKPAPSKPRPAAVAAAPQPAPTRALPERPTAAPARSPPRRLPGAQPAQSDPDEGPLLWSARP